MKSLAVLALLLIAEVLAVSALTLNEMAQLSNRRAALKVSSRGEEIRITSTNIPDHRTGKFPNTRNPYTIHEQLFNYQLPNNPSHANGTSCLPMGPIGFARNGVAIYSPFREETAPRAQDVCSGQPDQAGAYHYSRAMDCLSDNSTDQFLGVMMDGYPLYGPRKPDGSYISEEELDECHGATIDGRYRYYLTDRHPYIIGCFKGTPIDQKVRMNQLDFLKCRRANKPVSTPNMYTLPIFTMIVGNVFSLIIHLTVLK